MYVTVLLASNPYHALACSALPPRQTLDNSPHPLARCLFLLSIRFMERTKHLSFPLSSLSRTIQLFYLGVSLSLLVIFSFLFFLFLVHPSLHPTLPSSTLFPSLPFTIILTHFTSLPPKKRHHSPSFPFLVPFPFLWSLNLRRYQSLSSLLHLLSSSTGISCSNRPLVPPKRTSSALRPFPSLLTSPPLTFTLLSTYTSPCIGTVLHC